MCQAMADDRAAKGFYLFGGDDAPQFSCQGDAVHFDDFLFASSFFQHLGDERLVHRLLFAVGVEMSFCQLHCLSQHDAEGDARDVEFVSDLQGGSDGIAVFHERLLRQVGVALLEEALTLHAAVENDAVGATCFCHLHALADALNESLFTKGLHDA